VNLLGVGVVDDGDGIAAPALLGIVDTPRQGDVEFRRVRDVLGFRLARKVDGEEVGLAGVLDPLLREYRARQRDEHRDRHEHPAHDAPSSAFH